MRNLRSAAVALTVFAALAAIGPGSARAQTSTQNTSQTQNDSSTQGAGRARTGTRSGRMSGRTNSTNDQTSGRSNSAGGQMSGRTTTPMTNDPNDPTVAFQANVGRATATLGQIDALIDAINMRHQSQGAGAPRTQLESKTPDLAVRAEPAQIP